MFQKKFQTHTRSSSLPFLTKPGSLSIKREDSNEDRNSLASFSDALAKSVSSWSLNIRSNMETVELTPIPKKTLKELMDQEEFMKHSSMANNRSASAANNTQQNGLSHDQFTEKPKNSEVFSLSDSNTGSTSSLVSLDKCRMTLPLSSGMHLWLRSSLCFKVTLPHCRLAWLIGLYKDRFPTHGSATTLISKIYALWK